MPHGNEYLDSPCKNGKKKVCVLNEYSLGVQNLTIDLLELDADAFVQSEENLDDG